MTTALQEQLLTITQEMNKLKTELYSEQGGLAEKLNDLTARAAQVEESRGGGGGGARSAPPGRDCGGPSASTCYNRGAGEARGAPSSMRGGRGGGGEERQAGRQVDWAPGTRDRTRENRRGMMPQRRQDNSWTPYIIGLTLITIGPLRPLLLELLSFLYRELYPLVLGIPGGGDDDGEPAWYDQ